MNCIELKLGHEMLNCNWSLKLCLDVACNPCFFLEILHLFLKTKKLCTGVSIFVCLFIAGGLSLAIEGPSKTEIKCRDNEDGTCTVTYVPTAPGEYNITVKFADKNISGSPFVAKVTGTLICIYAY